MGLTLLLLCMYVCPAAIWKMLGNLNGQQKGIIEERFKTVDRELSKKGLAAGWRRAALEASAAAANSLRGSVDGPPGAVAAAGGYSAAPGQLSSTAGLISLSAAPEAAPGPRQAAHGANFSLQTGECATGSQHPSMLLTGPPGRGMAPAAAGGAAAAPMGMSVQIPEATVGLQSAPTSATAAPPKYQPLQSFSGPAEIYAEWDKCLMVLQHGESVPSTRSRQSVRAEQSISHPCHTVVCCVDGSTKLSHTHPNQEAVLMLDGVMVCAQPTSLQLRCGTLCCTVYQSAYCALVC
jgi:hypothetical protein